MTKKEKREKKDLSLRGEEGRERGGVGGGGGEGGGANPNPKLVSSFGREGGGGEG